MKQKNLLSKNLRTYQKMRKLTLTEFSQELDLPKSTLRAVLKEGNTTLDTAIRISEGMNTGLDLLVCDEQFSDKLFVMNHMEKSGAWFSSFPEEKKSEIAALLAKVWEVMGK